MLGSHHPSHAPAHARRTDQAGFMAVAGHPPVEWIVSDAPVGYEEAVAIMERHVARLIAGEAAERVWLVEHPPLYTAGTSADVKDLRAPSFPFIEPGAVANIPTMVPASGSPTRCSI